MWLFALKKTLRISFSSKLVPVQQREYEYGLWRFIKPKQPLQPITKGTDNPMNQSKLRVITWSWRKARESAWHRVTIGFGFTSDWMKKWSEFFLSQSCSVCEAKPITFWHSKENRYIKIIRLLQLTLWNQSLKLTRQDRKLVWVEVERCCRYWLLIKYISIINVISYVFFFCRLLETRFFSPHWIWKEIWTKSYATLKEKLPKSGLMS